MRSLLISLSAIMLLGACASQPNTPKENADTAALMGMMLIAAAAQQNGAAATSALWQVRIPPAAVEVITSIQAYRRTSRTWPQREDIPLPESITELLLHGTEKDLVVVLKQGDLVVARFTVLKDGSVLAAPLVEDLMSAMQSRAGGGVPSVPIPLPAKK